MIKLAEIKARAEAASPGPWKPNNDGLNVECVLMDDEHENHIAEVFSGDGVPGPQNEKNARHIATMDPATTLALVEELEQERAKSAKLKAAVEAVQEWVRLYDRNPITNSDASYEGTIRRETAGEVRDILAENGIEGGE